jgi:hypothetical protein
MLTLRQFKQKHALKFANLTKQEIASRYADYLGTSNQPVRKTAKLNKRGQITREMQVHSSMGAKAFLSPCASWYAKALTNPNGKFDELPCIPDVISLPSYKYQTQVRGSFQIGTAGSGFVAVKPFVPVNDIGNVEFSTGTYATTGYQPFPTPGILSAGNDSPFTTADLAGCEVRLVGCGVEVEYQGAEFNRGGLVVLHRQPGNTAITAGINAAGLLLYRTTSQAPALRTKELGVNYRPDTPSQLGYIPFNVPVQASTLMVYVEGAVPGMTWWFNVTSFWELIGNRQNPTPSHADPPGHGAVLGALPVKPPVQSPDVVYRAVVERAGQNLLMSTSTILPDLVRGVGTGMQIGYDLYKGNLSQALDRLESGARSRISETPMGGYMIEAGPSRGGPIIDEID